MYLIRWQLSTPLLALITYLLVEDCGSIITAVIANLIGGLLFYKIDKQIFKKR